MVEEGWLSEEYERFEQMLETIPLYGWEGIHRWNIPFGGREMDILTWYWVDMTIGQYIYRIAIYVYNKEECIPSFMQGTATLRSARSSEKKVTYLLWKGEFVEKIFNKIMKAIVGHVYSVGQNGDASNGLEWGVTRYSPYGEGIAKPEWEWYHQHKTDNE